MGFVLGIVLGFHLGNLLELWVIAICIVICCGLFFVRRVPMLRGAAVMFLSMSIGYGLTLLEDQRAHRDHYISVLEPNVSTELSGTIVNDPLERNRSVKLEVALESASDSGVIRGTVLLYLEKDSHALALRQGDVLVLECALKPVDGPMNPDAFDYRAYLELHQIYWQGYASSGTWKLVKRGDGFMRKIRAAQHAAIATLEQSGMDQRALAIVAALMVGYKHYLSADQVEAFAGAGAMHVLAVSGLHVGIIFLLLSFVLRPLTRIKRLKFLIPLLMLAGLWLYALLTGLSPSVSRASTMFSFIVIGQAFKREGSIYNSLAASALLLLVIDPYLLFEVGFQLSYLAVIGIVALQPRIYAWWQPKWWLLDKIWALTAVSIAAQLATFPLGLYYFHQFPNYFLLTNLVVIPAATVILPVGILLLSVSWWTWLSVKIGWVLAKLVWVLDAFVGWVESMPYAVAQGIDISLWQALLIYGLIVTGVGFLIRRHHHWLKLTTLLVIGLVLSNALEAFTQQRQMRIVFYSIRGFDAIDFIQGHNHVFVADSNLLRDDKSMGFSVSQHWWASGLNPPLDSLPMALISKSLLQFYDYSILLLDDSIEIHAPMKVNALMVTGRTEQHPKNILKYVRYNEMILSASLDWRTANYWKELGLEKGIHSVHDLRVDGAYIVE